MSDPSLASPRCPKCFAVVGEDDPRCPRCSFDFASLEQAKPKAKPIAATIAALKPKKVPAKTLAPKPVPAPKAAPPDLTKEIPFRWTPEADRTAPRSGFRWTRAFLLFSALAIVSAIGLAGASGWMSAGEAVPVLDSPGAQAAQDAAITVAQPGENDSADNPFPQRPEDPQVGAQALASAFSSQMRAMNSAL